MAKIKISKKNAILLKKIQEKKRVSIITDYSGNIVGIKTSKGNKGKATITLESGKKGYTARVGDGFLKLRGGNFKMTRVVGRGNDADNLAIRLVGKGYKLVLIRD